MWVEDACDPALARLVEERERGLIEKFDYQFQRC